MAICDADPKAGTITIRYAVVGRGTRLLTTARVGETIVTVGPLGQPFVLPAGGGGPVILLGRGIGICSLTLLGAHAAAAGHQVMAISSARTGQAVIGTEQYARSGVRVHEVNDDEGSSDVGRLHAILRTELQVTPPSLIAACGSRRLIAFASWLGGDWGSDVQVSIEAPMACGLGYCHGCATGGPTATTESPLVCSDGPVFRCS
jgi:dihydroorotate dehydrogenase electron transfer subunit